ncbi:MAG: hypothetical protein ACLGJC_18205, partial [Alphaproteobacteria bacterium]
MIGLHQADEETIYWYTQCQIRFLCIAGCCKNYSYAKIFLSRSFAFQLISVSNFLRPISSSEGLPPHGRNVRAANQRLDSPGGKNDFKSMVQYIGPDPLRSL